MMILIDANNRYIQDEHGQILLDERPAFSFPYVAISFSQIDSTKVVQLRDETVQAALEGQEIEELKSWAAAVRKGYGVRRPAADANGFYLGVVRINDSRVACFPDGVPPNDSEWKLVDGKWVPAFGFDKNGCLVNLKHPEMIGHTTKVPDPLHKVIITRWDFEHEEWSFNHHSAELFKDMARKEIMTGIISHLVSVGRDVYCAEGNIAEALRYAVELHTAIAAVNARWNPAAAKGELGDELKKIQASAAQLIGQSQSSDLNDVRFAYADFKELVKKLEDRAAPIRALKLDELILEELS
jgi:hypothetical protein